MDDPWDSVDMGLDVRAAIDSLSDRQRQAFILCVVDQGTQEQAASIMGVTQQAVQQLVQSAIENVREYCE